MPRIASLTLFTDAWIKKQPAAPAGKRIDLWDENVRKLGLRISDKGSKTFFLFATLPGKTAPVRHKLGSFGEITLAQARQKASDWKVMIADGKDPTQHEAEVKAAQIEARVEAETMECAAVIETFCNAVCTLPTEKNRDIKHSLRTHFATAWAGRRIDAIRRADIALIVEKKAATHPIQARALLKYVKRLFRWAAQRDLIEASVAEIMRAQDLLGAAPEARQRALSNEELAQVWHKTAALGYPLAPMYRLLILTGCRREEVVDIHSREIDRANRLWTIPGERMKNGLEHAIPLTDAMLAVIDSLPVQEGYLLSKDGGVSPMAFDSKTAVKVRDAVGIEHWCPKDLRTTARTGFTTVGVAENVAEAMIAHTKEGLKKVYDKNKLLPQKRDGFARWSAEVLCIVGESQRKVVQLHAA